MKNYEVESENVENENVIQISFGNGDSRDIPRHIAHPASKRYPESLEEDDPLAQLLAEGDLEDDCAYEDCDYDNFAHDNFNSEEENYIHAHAKPWSFNASFEDGPRQLGTSVLGQIKRLKEDAKRLKYYLDEMNID